MTTTEAVLEAVAERLKAEPAVVLPVLKLIAGLDELPVGRAAPATMVLRLSADRIALRQSEFRGRAFETSQVRQILGGISRQAVAQRLAHGGLLAAEIGGRLYFPDWQFAAGGTVPRLKELIAVLRGDGRSALAADALIRAPLPEEGGASCADLLSDGRFDLALHYAVAAGEGF